MADLLSTLIVPNSPRSSQDSFRSLPSQPRTNSPPLPSQPIPPDSAKPQASATLAAGLPVYDIDNYLAQNAATTGTENFPLNASQASHGTPVPVSLGTKTSFWVAALNTQCQSRGFLPVFEIEGDASDFGGVLKLRDRTVTSDRRWASKKEAREGLAEKGMEVVKIMEGKRKGAGITPQISQVDGKNWVGMLLEYHNANNTNLGPVYEDYALGTAYAATCTIPSLPHLPFGSKNEAFSSKKAARAGAAKAAVQYLIEGGELNEDGSTKSRKKVKLGTAVRIQGRGLEVNRATTYTQKVNDMCLLLGLTCPIYRLAPVSNLAPNMLSGYATFPNAPGIPAELGEVRNVFGKKKAKEEVAMRVWDFLKGLAAQRHVDITEKDGGNDEEREGGSP